MKGRLTLMWMLLGVAAAGCGGDTHGAQDDAAVGLDVVAIDVATLDGGAQDVAVPPVDAMVFDPGPEPTVPITPVVGEVTIIQLDVTSTIPALGEAAIIVGPDGTVVLLDIGNASHDDDVRAALTDLNTNHLTPANGFTARTPLQVEWIVITHMHGDHVGGFDDLLVDTAEPAQVTRGIVHRGFVDIGPALNDGDYEVMCAAMRGTYAGVDYPLCESAVAPSCTFGDLSDVHAANGCPGLHVGDLDDPGDDGAGAPTYIDLGDGARLTIVAANAHVSNGTTAVAAPAFGHTDSNEENARSLAGIISHGDFRYHFGGDMTGAGTATEPDIESHLVATAGPTFYGALGVDVAHLHHHVRNTSSNATLVGALAPNDGLSRNAIGGISEAHFNSPHAETLQAWGDANRLGEGRIWITRGATGGDTHPALVVANGHVILQTIQLGLGYRVQAAGAALFSLPFESVR